MSVPNTQNRLEEVAAVLWLLKTTFRLTHRQEFRTVDHGKRQNFDS